MNENNAGHRAPHYFCCCSCNAVNKNDNSKKSNADSKNVNPNDIKGKLEVPDTRERRDGPGGN